MKFFKTKFKDLLIYKKDTYKDNRGYFRELFYQKHFGTKFPFEYMSFSKKNVLRGLHLQTKSPQDKFITVLKGRILDVAVDVRKGSRTFGKHYKILLSEKNSKFLFIPRGFAHGFLGLDKENIVLYSCSNYRHKKSEQTILWNDTDLKINWGIKKPILSEKDKYAQTLKHFLNK